MLTANPAVPIAVRADNLAEQERTIVRIKEY